MNLWNKYSLRFAAFFSDDYLWCVYCSFPSAFGPTFFSSFPPLTKKQQHTHTEREHIDVRIAIIHFFSSEKKLPLFLFGPVCFLFYFFFPWLPIEYNKKEPGFFFLSFSFRSIVCYLFYICRPCVCVSAARRVASKSKWCAVCHPMNSRRTKNKKEEYKDTTTLLAPLWLLIPLDTI
jgi:hypothetical protein